MGLFGKLAFWKKEDLDFDKLAQKDLDLGMGKGGMPIQDDFDPEEKSPFGDKSTDFEHSSSSFTPRTPAANPMYQTQTASAKTTDRDLELISSKLDTIKAILSSMDQRIANLERATGVDKNKERLW